MQKDDGGSITMNTTGNTRIIDDHMIGYDRRHDVLLFKCVVQERITQENVDRTGVTQIDLMSIRTAR